MAEELVTTSYLTEKIAGLDRHLTAEIASLRREAKAANVTAERAVKVASDEAKERLSAHNGLIDQMRNQASFYATRETVETIERHQDEKLENLAKFQAKIIGGLVVVATIGAANFVKLWTG